MSPRVHWDFIDPEELLPLGCKCNSNTTTCSPTTYQLDGDRAGSDLVRLAVEVKVEICTAMQSVMRERELHIDAETNARCNIAYMSKCGQAKDNNSNEGNASKESPANAALKRTTRRLKKTSRLHPCCDSSDRWCAAPLAG